MILGHMVNIDEMLKLTQGQGHKVKGQGHRHPCEKMVLTTTHESIDGS